MVAMGRLLLVAEHIATCGVLRVWKIFAIQLLLLDYVAQLLVVFFLLRFGF